MKKFFIILVFLLTAPLVVVGAHIDYFSQQVDRLNDILKNAATNDYALSAVASEICEEVSQMSTVRVGAREYSVNLFWIKDVAFSIQDEGSPKKRRLIFSNLVDTLNGLVEDMQTTAQESGSTKKEMHDALDRAMGKTSEVKFADGVPVSASIEWAGNGGYVVAEAGEGVSIISAEPVGSVSGSYSSFNSSSSNSSSSNSSSNSFSSHSQSTSSARSHGAGTSTNTTTPMRQTHHTSTVQPQKAQNSNPVRKTIAKRKQPVPAKPIPQKKSTPLPKLPKPPKVPKSFADYIFWIIMGVCIIGFLVMLYFIVRKTRKKLVHDKEAFEKIEHSLPPERLKNETIYEKALQAASQGNFSEGIRLLTIGSLLMLETQRVISFQDSLTNGEYLRELLRERQLYSMFKEPMGLFDLLIYGLRKPGQQDFEKFKSFYLELEKVQK